MADRRWSLWALLLAVVMSVAGCFSPASGVNPDDDPTYPMPPVNPVEHAFYAHSSTTLYKIDPRTNALTEVGAFGGEFSGGATDLAMNAAGELYVVTGAKVFRVDPMTAVATLVVDSAAVGNALTFLPVDFRDPDGPERLIAGVGSNIVEINLADGTFATIGNIGDGSSFAGDLFYVKDVGIYATLNAGSGGTFARLDPQTFAAQAIGVTGFAHVWGLAFYGGTFYGFSAGGEMFTIDVATGAGTQVDGPLAGVSFWGAGVSTVAPVTPIS